MAYHYTPAEELKSKTVTIPNARNDMEQYQLTTTAVWSGTSTGNVKCQDFLHVGSTSEDKI